MRFYKKKSDTFIMLSFTFMDNKIPNNNLWKKKDLTLNGVERFTKAIG